MRILYIITKAVVGGAQTSVLNLAREMKARGNDVIVGAGDGSWLPAELAKENISFHYFKNLKRTHNPLSPFFFITEVRRFLKEENFDVVHFNSSNALPGAVGVKLANKKIKTVFTFRGMSILDEHYKINPILRFLYRLFFRFFLLFVDEAVFVSRENFAKFGRGSLTKKGAMIHNGLNPAKINFLLKEQVLGCFHEKTNYDFSEKYIVGSIGRLDYAKNYEFLINIFPEVLKIKPRAVAVIIGEGPDRKKYEILIEKNNLQEKIFLLGNIENGSRYLKGFDVLVLPSRYEGLSITLLEALFAGLPVLASAVGGNSEAVSLPKAEIYELDNKKNFLEKFEFLQTPEILKEIKEKNKRLMEKFGLENSADGYEKIYKK